MENKIKNDCFLLSIWLNFRFTQKRRKIISCMWMGCGKYWVGVKERFLWNCTNSRLGHRFGDFFGDETQFPVISQQIQVGTLHKVLIISNNGMQIAPRDKEENIWVVPRMRAMSVCATSEGELKAVSESKTAMERKWNLFSFTTTTVETDSRAMV